MSTNTMNFELPRVLRSEVHKRVRSSQHGNSSEDLRELICQEQEEQAKARMRELIEAGLNSGQGRSLTRKLAADLKERALGSAR